MIIQDQGTDPAVAVPSSPATAGRTREAISTVTLRLRAERLEVAAHQGAYVWFAYEPHPHVHSVHSGRVEYLTRPIPPDDVEQDEMPTLLRIERVWYSLPAGTLVTVETGEIR